MKCTIFVSVKKIKIIETTSPFNCKWLSSFLWTSMQVNNKANGLQLLYVTIFFSTEVTIKNESFTTYSDHHYKLLKTRLFLLTFSWFLMVTIFRYQKEKGDATRFGLEACQKSNHLNVNERDMGIKGVIRNYQN